MGASEAGPFYIMRKVAQSTLEGVLERLRKGEEQATATYSLNRLLRPDGQPIPGLYAAGEVAGFGGGGVHGYRALEGTFLGGCLFGGRIAGRAAAEGVCG